HVAEPKRVLPHLFLLIECDRPTAGGVRYCLEGLDVVEFGRANERQAHVSDAEPKVLRVGVPGRSMSATHARLVAKGGDFVLEDRGSTNGSFVNGARTTTKVLADGDVIELGHTLFMLRTTIPTPAYAPRVFDSSERPAPHPAFATLLPTIAEELVTLGRVAKSELTVLVNGDTGTGKELLARGIHELSERSGPFVAVNCGALPPNLVESSLFGHVKGAFSGAHRDELGFLRAANQGTLLLDEIGDLPLAAQASLLRVLEEREVVPVGSARPQPFDARVIAATHRNLDALVRDEKFRGDLLSRLGGYKATLRPLAERREDLGLLVKEVLGSLPEAANAKLSPEAGLALVRHDYPFNVRELVHELERAVVISDGGVIQKTHLFPGSDGSGPSAGAEAGVSELSPEDAALRDELVRHLTEHRGNVADVARVMGKARMQIHRWLKRFDIDPGIFRLKQKT
ncbi:MAG TPA: sigma 54-interacting transcriptional regulator, partial [Polyangiaceae bacterium]